MESLKFHHALLFHLIFNFIIDSKSTEEKMNIFSLSELSTQKNDIKLTLYERFNKLDEYIKFLVILE